MNPPGAWLGIALLIGLAVCAFVSWEEVLRARAARSGAFAAGLSLGWFVLAIGILAAILVGRL